MEVALGRHGHPLGRRQQADRRIPGEIGRLGVGYRGPVLHPGTEAIARPLVEGPVADDHVGHARLDGHRRLLDGGAARAPAVVDAAEEGQLAHAQAAGDLDLRIGVGAEGDQPVDLGRLDAGVAQGQVDRLHRQAEVTAAGLLGELGGPDAGDGGVAGVGVAVSAHRPGRRCPTGGAAEAGRCR